MSPPIGSYGFIGFGWGIIFGIGRQVSDILEPDRELCQQLFIRICRDTRFTVSAPWAAAFVGKMLGLGDQAGLMVWAIMKISLEDMDRIANGTHPCLKLKRYGGTNVT